VVEGRTVVARRFAGDARPLDGHRDRCAHAEARVATVTESDEPRCGVVMMNRLPGDGESLIVGRWVQFIRHDDGSWWNGGLYHVHCTDRQPRMEPDGYDDATKGIVKSIRLSDVTLQDNVWRFTSDWENGLSGTFVLARIDDDHFEGHVYVNGVQWSANRWERVAAAGARAATDRSPEKRAARNRRD
jgi:hypothetical protein